MNNESKYLIIAALVCSEYLNIRYLIHLIIGNTQKFVLGGKKMVSEGRNSNSTTNLLYFTQ